MTEPRVISVNQSPRHGFSKQPQLSVRLIEGLGIEGDAHAGVTTQHLHQQRQDPTRPNLRQVHLIHSELLSDLRSRNYTVHPGELGENVTTAGVDLLNLAEGTLLHLGSTAVVRVTGLRTPCVQIDRYCAGLMTELIADAAAKKYLSGVMSVVVASGDVYPGDVIRVQQPSTFVSLKPV